MINKNHSDSIFLLLIGFVLVFVIVNTNQPNSVEHTESLTPYEMYPDAYENSSFNPANGYIEGYQ